ncbi:hypothetical protein KP509_13G025800 [Ceratopteris richardii]|uniref:Uncharacterized protein n=1 Tax=Ceratopteris richardii TaxID=49495 RepID=A0A8T2TGA1_CERRI|nr:hypothetical protein KP509_13G025800 [Ceratopteris richardii]
MTTSQSREPALLFKLEVTLCQQDGCNNAPSKECGVGTNLQGALPPSHALPIRETCHTLLRQVPMRDVMCRMLMRILMILYIFNPELLSFHPLNGFASKRSYVYASV